MFPIRENGIGRIVLAVFFVLALLYAAYEARGIVLGPSITITSSTAATSSGFIDIIGHADRIASLKLNGRSIPVTEDGNFDQPYLLVPGENRIIFDATDRYGRGRQTAIDIYSTATSSSTSILPAASSTPSDATSSTSTASTTPIAPLQ